MLMFASPTIHVSSVVSEVTQLLDGFESITSGIPTSGAFGLRWEVCANPGFQTEITSAGATQGSFAYRMFFTSGFGGRIQAWNYDDIGNGYVAPSAAYVSALAAASSMKLDVNITTIGSGCNVYFGFDAYGASTSVSFQASTVPGVTGTYTLKGDIGNVGTDASEIFITISYQGDEQPADFTVDNLRLVY